MSNLIKELTTEAHEIITNICRAYDSGEIDKETADSLKRQVLDDVANAAGLPTLAVLEQTTNAEAGALYLYVRAG